MSKSKSGSRTRLSRRVGIVAGAATVATLGLVTPAYAEAKLTLSATSGPSATATAITATATTAVFTGITPVVQFVTTGSGSTVCPLSYSNPVERVISVAGVQSAGIVGVPAANVRKVTESKIVITTPTTALNPGGAGAELFNATGLALAVNGSTTQTTAKYNVCVYAGTTAGNATTSGLLASGTYTIAASPTITNITPESGPSLGGTKVTVTGTGFTTGTTASIGGSALSSVVVNATGTQFTAITPARTAGADLKLVVTATGGSVDSTADVQTDDDYSYLNGITVQPNTNAGADSVTLDISGVGFSAYTWLTPTNTLDASPHIFLVEGTYNGANSAAQVTALEADTRTNGPAAECTDVLVIGDTELICNLDITKSVDPVAGTSVSTRMNEGAYVVTVVNTGANNATPTFQTKVTSGSIFTVAAY
ncbi:IPT/TIG domain-containing protein [Actinoplanes awajinensis]|uniref:IPT/TIG domain-containing protein n=1 Tax=Actinoplanes awajinensis subsp. mycoplanecinus TaxID=135947 RepID=A0A124GAM2_9ACTN|nr:IPT/TIG domain-containing protein [Actinoplanes awajinensis]KUL32651.1 hypothetical protein ADL15_19235 [Actinoplanes awajinensis subsp. mycoplanecinus]